MAARRKHMGVTTNNFRGVTSVRRKNVEIGRVSTSGPRKFHPGGPHVALARVGGGAGYRHIGTFPTHKAAVDAVARSTHTYHQLPTKTPGLKRPKNLPFRKRSHPTQSLGV